MEFDFEAYGIDAKIVRAIKEIGFEQLTPIQEQAIPLVLQGKDITGQAQTGTGKTAAFGIPALQMIDKEMDGVQCLILCPTRELAIQGADELRKFSKFLHGVKVLPIYGGQDISIQIRQLRSNVSIIVGTPGRVMDHMRRHTLKFDNLKMVVLDEADEMLNMGFREDIETILQEVPSEHQTVLFSATMPKAILDITNKYQKDAEFVKVAQKELTIPLVKQYYYEVNKQNKQEVVARLLDYYNPKLTLIFCNTKMMVDTLAKDLKGRGYFAEGLHGDLTQNQRDRVMNAFRKGTIQILIATDVAARGIDVDDVEAVFNYDIPQDIEYYVHRIGRTGRAGKKGRSFTLISGREFYKIREIENACKTKIKPRMVPSAADVTAAKAEKILNGITEIMHEKDLTEVTKIIERKMNDDDCTAMDMAAAFLKQLMGDDIEEVDLNEKREKSSRGNRSYGSTGRSYGSGERRVGGNREGGHREGSSYGRSYRGKSEGSEGRSYTRKSEGSEGRSYTRKSEGSEGRSYTRKSEGSEGRSYTRKRDGESNRKPSDGGKVYGIKGDDKKESSRGGYSRQKSYGSKKNIGDTVPLRKVKSSDMKNDGTLKHRAKVKTEE